MSVLKRRSARHRAETTSHAVRNTTIAAAAGAAMIGSIAPAQASAQAPAASGAVHSAYAAPANHSTYAYQATPTPQPSVAAQSYRAPVPQPAAPAAERTVAPQSSASGKGATISSAAMGQLGVAQDCTALVTNALRAAGISHHGWPASYLGLGTQVSAAQAQPGDLVYYADGGMGAAHVAVYIGGGKAVHGGWNGYRTVIDSVNVGSGPVFVRVR